MATQNLYPGAELYPSSAYASYIVVFGTNFPYAGVWFAGGSSDSKCYFLVDTSLYISGNLTVDIFWVVDGSVTSGTVKFGARIAAITPDTDSQDISTKSFGTQATVIDTHLGTIAKRVHKATITISSLDSLAASDYCVMEIVRVASDITNDTITDGVIITQISVTY